MHFFHKLELFAGTIDQTAHDFVRDWHIDIFKRLCGATTNCYLLLVSLNVEEGLVVVMMGHRRILVFIGKLIIDGRERLDLVRIDKMGRMLSLLLRLVNPIKKRSDSIRRHIYVDLVVVIMWVWSFQESFLSLEFSVLICALLHIEMLIVPSKF